MNLFKRFGAALLCIVLIMGCFAACHGKDAVVATANNYDGTEVISVPSGVYLAMLVNADNEARNLVSEQLGDSAKDDIKFAKQKVKAEDGTEYKFYDYIEMRAKELCRDYIATRYLFDKNDLELTDTEQSTMASYIQYQWAYTGARYIYEPNGVSYDSFNQFMGVISYERSSLFDFYYDNGGEFEPTRDIVEKGLEDNFVVANVIEIKTKDSENKTLTEEKLAEIEAKLSGYADRINGGEQFSVIKEEYDAEVKAEENAEGTSGSDTSSSATSSSSVTDPTAEQPEDRLATVFGAEKTSAANGNFSELAKLEIGRASVVKGTDGYYRMVVRKDIHADEYYYNNYKNEVTRILYADEFEDYIADCGKNIEITYDSYELGYLKPANIDYDEYQKWYASLYSGANAS